MIDMGRLWCLALLSLFFSSALAQVASSSSSSNTYDYIVVGSGPGGGTLAANLAKAGQSVLLLEAGDDQGSNPNEEIAGWFFKAFSDPVMRWDFFVKLHSDDAITAQYEHLTWLTTDGQFYVGTTPPAGAKLLGVYYPRAGTLGGCSTHNAMIAALPSHSDWDYIAQITGDSSWNHNNMQQFFAQLETDHVVPPGTPGHGFSGPLDMTVNGPEYLRNQSNAFKVLQATAKYFGQNPANLSNILTYSDLNNNDANHDQQVGLFGCPAHRTPNGRRVSSRTLVVNVWNATNPNGSKKYPNFDVRLHAFATKILFNTNGAVPRAIGVEYLAGESMYNADPRHNYTANPGVKTQVFARKEVIVAGGTFNSPQLLMLSGIGPKADLQALSIPVIVDLPGVGTNLQDNTEMGVSAEANQDFTSIGPPCTYGGTPDDPCLPLWEAGQGPYIEGPLGAVMFKSSQAALNERDFMMFPLSAGSFNGYWPGETVNVVPGPTQSNFDFSMVKIHTQSHSGTVKLASNNPRDTPLINFRFFEGPGADADLQAYADAIQFGRTVFDSLNSTLGPWTETLPCQGNRSCDVKAFVKAQAWSHHATSSCSIGADSNPLAVLDSKFRVRGTKGLRVVDASAFPRTPGAFPVLPTFILGMKGSAAVLADANSW